jgi:hypothetical protein
MYGKTPDITSWPAATKILDAALPTARQKLLF